MEADNSRRGIAPILILCPHEDEQWGIPRVDVVPTGYSNWSMGFTWYTCMNHSGLYSTIEVIYNDFS